MSDPQTVFNRIRRHLSRAMREDRYALTAELNRIGKALEKKPGDEALLKKLEALERKLGRSMERKNRRKAGVPAVRYPGELPITVRKNEIVRAIRENPVVVITGETGSGKTTQIPKMCLEAGRGIGGIIGHTQPRRVAAITAAQRISEELGEALGRSVGYKIRFDEKSGPDAYIKVMTDGILLAEVQTDPYLNAYDTIIVDEAHERSLNIDFILGILRSLLRKRHDLRVVITSATIDTEKFSRAFDDAPIIEVSGRLYPVEVRYAPLDPEKEESGDWTFVDAAAGAVDEILHESRGGDILVFMPTEADIRETCDILAARKGREDLAVLPLFARLTWNEQRRVFQPAKNRKVIVATNVAETSITIPGIRYVVDTGLARISRYNPRTRTLNLPVSPVSRSSADQRKGRCGRVQNGICIRLYGEEDYEARPLYTPPEILRSNLAEVILRMLALNIGDVASFPFIDPPDPKSIRDGFETLRELGGIAPREGGSGFRLTDRGRLMARMPIDPRIARMILEAEKEGCLKEVAVIASALSIQDPREWPAEKLEEARRMHEPFKHPASDFMTLLNIWDRFHETWTALKTQNRMRAFCREHFLSFRRMREWIDLHGQISEILEELGLSAGEPQKEMPDHRTLYGGIHRAILSGCLSNITLKKEKNLYIAARGREAMIFPGSTLFNRGSDWIVAAEMVETSRLFARVAAHIESEWLEPLGGDLCRYTYSNAHWERKRGEVVASEQVTLFGLVIVPSRHVSYGRIDPGEAAKIFIRRALVEGDVERPLPFLRHNLDLIERVSRMEDKLRRRDILVGEEVLESFYETRLAGVFDIRTLQKLVREKGDGFLRMEEDDLLVSRPGEDELALFPEKLPLGTLNLPLAYRFDPRESDDGVTLKIPQRLVPLVSAPAVDWAVPGLLKEKITLLLKGLPKTYRKRLLPLAGTAEAVLAGMPKGEGSLPAALSTFIYRKFGVDIPASAWNQEALPDHLRMRLAVVDQKGREITAGRDIGILREEAVEDAGTRGFEKARSRWEKKGLARWDFGDLPEVIPLGEEGRSGVAFPGLEAGEDGVNLRLFKSFQEAAESHRRGVIALFSLQAAKDLKVLRRQLTLPAEMKPWAVYFGGAEDLEEALCERTLLGLFNASVREEKTFRHLSESAAANLLPRGQEVIGEVKPLLRAYHKARQSLQDMEQANRSGRTALRFLNDMRAELDRLVPRDFMKLYEKDRLRDLPRYLEAVLLRAESGLLHMEKDRERAEKIRIFADRIEGLREGLTPHSSEEKRRAVEDYQWMIEEYRISVFAQRLKTAFPVSPKRLEERFREIERMT